jgi:hypothetical protein
VSEKRPEILEAAWGGDFERVRALLAEDPSRASERGRSGFVPLHTAVSHSREYTELLLDAGADVNAQNDYGIAPLHLAGYAEIVDLLVSRGADLNLRSKDGRTPAWVHASERDNGRVLLRLLELGADPNARDDRGQTPLDIALRRYPYDNQVGEPDRVAVLRQFGAVPGREKELADVILSDFRPGRLPPERERAVDDFPGAGLLEVPDEIDDEIQRLAHEAGALASTDRAGALALLQQAYALLPEPRTAYHDAIWLLPDVGREQFRLGRFAEAKATLLLATQEVDGAADLPDVRMFLGQCLFELGEQPAADDWLVSAYELGQAEAFRREDPKYLARVTQVLASRRAAGR